MSGHPPVKGEKGARRHTFAATKPEIFVKDVHRIHNRSTFYMVGIRDVQVPPCGSDGILTSVVQFIAASPSTLNAAVMFELAAFAAWSRRSG